MPSSPPVLRDSTSAEMDLESQRTQIAQQLPRGLCCDVDLLQTSDTEFQLNIGVSLTLEPGESLRHEVLHLLETMVLNLVEQRGSVGKRGAA